MPARSKQLWSVLVIAGSVSLLTSGCGSSGSKGKETDPIAMAEIKKINTYLGTADGINARETTLLENIKKNNLFLQGVLTTMQCDIWKLQHPGQQCPGPSTSPTVPPRYPQ